MKRYESKMSESKLVRKFSLADLTESQMHVVQEIANKFDNVEQEAFERYLKEARKVDAAESFAHFRNVPKTGVIYATSRAAEHGYDECTVGDWANMGQGAPECGELPNQPPRPTTVEFTLDHQEYAPVQGLPGLRDAVAQHYNELYRKGEEIT